MVIFSSATAFQIFLPPIGANTLMGNGGYVGNLFQEKLQQEFSVLGSAVLLGSICIAGSLLALDSWFHYVWHGIYAAGRSSYLLGAKTLLLVSAFFRLFSPKTAPGEESEIREELAHIEERMLKPRYSHQRACLMRQISSRVRTHACGR